MFGVWVKCFLILAFFIQTTENKGSHRLNTNNKSNKVFTIWSKAAHMSASFYKVQEKEEFGPYRV